MQPTELIPGQLPDATSAKTQEWRKSLDGAVDQDDRAGWVKPLRTPGPIRDAAVLRLHELLLRAARHQVAQMAEAQCLSAVRLEEIVHASADEATASVLCRLSEFEGRSKFTTWAYKFGIVQTAVQVRRAAWNHRDRGLDPIVERAGRAAKPTVIVEPSELSREVAEAMQRVLTPAQRQVALALLVDGVPIDVLADRLGTNRNALYTTLHDARRLLRADLMDRGLLPPIPASPEDAAAARE